MTPAGTHKRIERVLLAYGLPTKEPEGLSREQLAATMALDKKAEGSKVNVVLLTQIGACTGMPVDSEKLAQML